MHGNVCVPCEQKYVSYVTYVIYILYIKNGVNALGRDTQRKMDSTTSKLPIFVSDLLNRVLVIKNACLYYSN